MITLIIGLSLNFVATGILYYLNNELKKKLENNNRALLALQKEFTQYQVSEKRSHEKETAKREIRFDNVAKSIKKNEQKINYVEKTLPERIGTFISQVEFAQDTLKKK